MSIFVLLILSAYFVFAQQADEEAKCTKDEMKSAEETLHMCIKATHEKFETVMQTGDREKIISGMCDRITSEQACFRIVGHCHDPTAFEAFTRNHLKETFEHCHKTPAGPKMAETCPIFTRNARQLLRDITGFKDDDGKEEICSYAEMSRALGKFHVGLEANSKMLEAHYLLGPLQDPPSASSAYMAKALCDFRDSVEDFCTPDFLACLSEEYKGLFGKALQQGLEKAAKEFPEPSYAFSFDESCST